ncbi:B-cell linker protein isoform X2 [Coregonus clupeaformis]|uniref:B-cell linker protein isoform X2 n=1 Tax=Coregonus clupeaformis TaxID=59861 RepID=UPI001BE014AC|nr:B-cell linker protein isoform X2 [Coregonus clupeaformis]
MEPWKRGNKTKQRYGRYSNVEEDRYHVPDNHEEEFLVHIHPARSHESDRDYADRDISRSSYAQSISSTSSGSPIIPPRNPRRGLPCTPPGNTGPAVNRQLKPGKSRRTQLDDRTQVMESTEQNMLLPPRSTPSLPKNLIIKLAGLDLQRPCRREQRGQQHVECNTPSKGHCSGRERTIQSQRYSLDLEFQLNTDIRLQQRHNTPEESSVKRQQHHEWPQTKDDVEQHDFVPKERPCQTYNEQDWYIGACDRAEAEHALHLVNKDGAFLVRNCSRNTDSEPFVLAVFHDKRVFNVKIRFIDSTSKYALGTGQSANDVSRQMFDTVADIVKFHTIFPVVLINGRNQSASKYHGNCVLTYPITKEVVNQLLE